MYLAQIQDLQQQLEQEHLKVQRLEMAIKGFSIALQEEMKRGNKPLFYYPCKAAEGGVKFAVYLARPFVILTSDI